MPATETLPVIGLVPALETGKPIGRDRAGMATVLVEGQSVIEIARVTQNFLKLEFEFAPGQPSIIQGDDTHVDEAGGIVSVGISEKPDGPRGADYRCDRAGPSRTPEGCRSDRSSCRCR